MRDATKGLLIAAIAALTGVPAPAAVEPPSTVITSER